MGPEFSFYTKADFGRVLRFMHEIPDQDGLPYEAVRFQFCMGLHIDFVEGGLKGGFERTCGLWSDEDGIAALAMTEGGTRWGETFFLFRAQRDETPELMRRMCEFAERFTSKVSEDRKSNAYKLCVPQGDDALASFVAERGYQRTKDRERLMVKTYSQAAGPAALPEGFIIRDARTTSPFFSALAHNHAFRYYQANDGGEKGFEAIRTMPGYRPQLDLVLFDPEGQPAGLANFWVNEKTRTATLEPLGVVWWYRKMGLGKALINEGIARTRRLGCERMIGGDQPFYWALGFEAVRENYFWAWSSQEN